MSSATKFFYLINARKRLRFCPDYCLRVCEPAWYLVAFNMFYFIQLPKIVVAKKTGSCDNVAAPLQNNQYLEYNLSNPRKCRCITWEHYWLSRRCNFIVHRSIHLRETAQKCCSPAKLCYILHTKKCNQVQRGAKSILLCTIQRQVTYPSSLPDQYGRLVRTVGAYDH